MKKILFYTIFILFTIGGSNVVNGQIFQQFGLDFQSFGTFINKWFGFGQKTQDIQPNLQIPVPIQGPADPVYFPQYENIQPNLPIPVPIQVPTDPVYVQQYEPQPPLPVPLPAYPYPYSTNFEQSQIIAQNLANPNLRFDPNYVQIEPNANPFPTFTNFKSQRSIRFNDESQNPNGIYSARKADQANEVKAPAEASTEASTTEKMFKILEDFPCPKMGSWRWDGEYCIAVGVWPTWGCKPLDLIMTGRMGVCRNKFKMNLIHLNKPKEESNSTKTAA